MSLRLKLLRSRIPRAPHFDDLKSIQHSTLNASLQPLEALQAKAAINVSYCE